MSGTYKTTGAQDGDSPTGDIAGARGSPGRCPRDQHKDDCTRHYQRQRLSCIVPEASPSAGWRQVYDEMGVAVDGR